MVLSYEQSIIAAIVISFIAYAIGRNLFLYFILAWLNPLVAVIILAVRAKVQPKPGARWIYEIVSRVKLRMWSRKFEPSDFEDPKK